MLTVGSKGVAFSYVRYPCKPRLFPEAHEASVYNLPVAAWNLFQEFRKENGHLASR